ncbi:MAG TPA: HAD family phosphatase [Acidobacteriaceae bacterium]|nr:HAD family phosphatase [Acidobacteriaceae bacterium]
MPIFSQHVGPTSSAWAYISGSGYQLPWIMLRAVIFDYGEVLCTQDHAAHQRLIALTGLHHDTFESLYWRDRHSYDLGRFDGRGFWAQFASDAGLTFTSEQIDALIETDVVMWTSISEAMLAWARSLPRTGILIAILSNMVQEVLDTMRQKFSWLAEFNQLTWSCELGIAKPDPAIYTLTCEKLGVAPADALFLDDRLVNVRAAEQLGLMALQFRSIEQLSRDLASPTFDGLPKPVPV